MALFLAFLTLNACAEDDPFTGRGPRIEGTLRAQVTDVADGDTFQVALVTRDDDQVYVRVLGIDCPESRFNDKCERDGREGRLDCEEQIPLGRQATARAIELVGQRQVLLEPGVGGVFEWDAYNRLLAYVRLPDQRDYGQVLLEEGLCGDFSWRYPHPREDEYRPLDTYTP